MPAARSTRLSNSIHPSVFTPCRILPAHRILLTTPTLACCRTIACILGFFRCCRGSGAPRHKALTPPRRRNYLNCGGTATHACMHACKSTHLSLAACPKLPSCHQVRLPSGSPTPSPLLSQQYHPALQVSLQHTRCSCCAEHPHLHKPHHTKRSPLVCIHENAAPHPIIAQNSLKSIPPSPSWSTAPMMASTSAASAPGTPCSSAAATSARLMVPLPSASRLEKAWGYRESRGHGVMC